MNKRGSLERKESHGIQKRPLVKCPYQDCDKGLVKGLFNSLAECHQCNGLGLVDAETGEALPEREVIRQLVVRLTEVRAKARWMVKELQRSNQLLRQRLEQYERGK